ncbi:hypothetical protein EBZ39_00345 [bacterium]|nr:hypothetical protein [bacterium]
MDTTVNDYTKFVEISRKSIARGSSGVMGLDAYMFRVAADRAVAEHKIQGAIAENLMGTAEKVYYWRNNWDMHSAMEDIWHRHRSENKNVSHVSFNCEFVRLQKDELEDIGRRIWEERFYDDPNDAAFNKEADLEFIETARVILESGDALYYYGWW